MDAARARFPPPRWWRAWFAALALALLLQTPGTAAAPESRQETEVEDARGALRLKLIAVVSILASGAAGVLVPVLGRSADALRPDGDVFLAVKAFAAGVILATGMVHILPAAFDALSAGGARDRFPYAGFVAMCAALATMTVDSAAAGYYQRSRIRKARPVDSDVPAHDLAAAVDVETGAAEHAGHAHVHGGPVAGSAQEDASVAVSIRHRVISQVLELGILVHSVIIGVSLGASVTPSTIRPLVGALSFHQFFEGVGLGGCIVQAKFKARVTVIMATFFSLTAPVGIALGIAITSSYKNNNNHGAGSTALVVEGVFNFAAAGILIYMSLVDLFAAEFTGNLKLQTSVKLQLATYLSLFLGAGVMSVLAKWA